MDNRKKKKNRNKSRQVSNVNTGKLNAKPELTEDIITEDKNEKNEESKVESKTENKIKNTDKANADTPAATVTIENKTDKSEIEEKTAPKPQETDKKQPEPEKADVQKKNEKTDTLKKAERKKETHAGQDRRKSITEFSAENIKEIAVKAAKVLLPAAACVIIVAVIASYVGSQKIKAVENSVSGTEADGEVTALSDQPLEENAYSSINELMNTFYAALADGDMDTVKAIKDYNNDKEIITYEKKSEFIEYYDNINCYTKPGISENTYFVYVTYTVKIQDIETKAPGLNAWYVYTAGDGNLKIDGDTEENIKAAFKLVTSQDDVVDLYNKIDVSYKEAVASDESLSAFMDELPAQIKTSVGEALAQLEVQEESNEAVPTEVQTAGNEQTQTPETEPETVGENEEQPQNQVVNQIVRATDTVNVRSSDSEEADKIGKVQSGTELTRIEDRVNGWSKVIFEDREAYIKSDYLEVVTTEATAEPIGTITALTNVNVRSQASQESAKLGTAQAGSSYDLLEDQGEWFKINYNGTTGFVKAEFFEK